MEHVFAINGQWLYGPDGYQEEPIPQVGATLSGKPILQGYHTFTFTWSFLNQVNMSALWEKWNPANPQVDVTYIDKATGELAIMTAMMHEPIVGARNIVFYQNVAVKFSRCV